MTLKSLPVSRKEDLVVQELKDEVLIYDLKNHNAYCLNEGSAAVWQSCDGSKSAEKIAKDVSKKLSRKVSEDYVWFALEQLKEKSLVICDESNPKFEGLSRRQLIRDVGLSSLVALPIISMLVSPMAAHAQSGSAAAAVCNTCSKKTSGECATCGTQLGNCYDNSGCADSGLLASNVTCSQCSTIGTPGGQSWRGI